MSRVASLLARVGLALGSLAVVLLLLEVACRLTVPQWRDLLPQRFMAFSPDGVLGGVPDFDGRVATLFPGFDVAVRLDARGFRNPSDADPAAPLAWVGDSFCFGWGLASEQSYAALTAARLGLASYNFCAVGADLVDDLHIVRRWLPARRTGATVLTITFENDVLAYPPTAGGDQGAELRGLSRQGASQWLMRHSALFDVSTTLARQSATIVAAVHRLGLVSGVPVVAEGTDPIAASIRLVRAIERAAGDGPFLVLLVPPRPGQVELVDYDAFAAAVRTAGFDAIDPRAAGVEITTFPRDGHWDTATNAAVASLLAERLTRAGVR